MSTGTALYTIDTSNPKEIIISGLTQKVEEQGNLRVGFDITTDYPSRETFEHDLEEHRRYKRRIIVRKLNNVMQNVGIGKQVSNVGVNRQYPDFDDVYGWVDQYMMEVSVWSPDSADRDNIVELVKLWMLELEQEIQVGEIQVPFFAAKDMFAIRFIRAYEDANYNLIQNGPMYIGSLVYECTVPFFHENKDALQEYKVNIVGRIKETLSLS